MVDSSGLENRYSLKQRTIEGSNPSLSFFLVNRFLSLFIFDLSFNVIIIKGEARLSWIAEPGKIEFFKNYKRAEKPRKKYFLNMT